MTLIAEFRERVKALERAEATPLVNRLGELNTSIAELDEKAKTERAERKQIIEVLRRIDPELAPPLYNGKRNGKAKKNMPKSPGVLGKEKMDALVEWLQAHKEELNGNGGFRAVDLVGREDFTLSGHQSNVNKALNVLYDQGILHVDRWVRGRDYPDRPTGKFYRVV